MSKLLSFHSAIRFITCMKNHRASATALFVLNGVEWIRTHDDLTSELPDAMSEANHTMAMRLNRGIFSMHHALGRYFWRIKTTWMQSLALPGLYLHFVLRKRCIERLVRKSIYEDAEQVVIMGAGYDTLGLRLSDEFPDLSVIQIDHPATLNSRRKSGDQLKPNMHIVELNHRDNTLKGVLTECEYYDPSKRSIFLAEGLLMYLPENAVRDIFQFIKHHASPQSKFIFTYMEENTDGDYHFKNASWFTILWLKLKHESFTWGLSSENFIPFLTKMDFKLLNNNTHKDLRKEFLSDKNKTSPLAMGENIALVQNSSIPLCPPS